MDVYKPPRSPNPRYAPGMMVQQGSVHKEAPTYLESM